jgi:hypothetical protein
VATGKLGGGMLASGTADVINQLVSGACAKPVAMQDTNIPTISADFNAIRQHANFDIDVSFDHLKGQN